MTGVFNLKLEMRVEFMLKQNRETLLYFHTSLYMQTATLSHENYCCVMVPHGPCSPQVISIQI